MAQLQFPNQGSQAQNNGLGLGGNLGLAGLGGLAGLFPNNTNQNSTTTSSGSSGTQTSSNLSSFLENFSKLLGQSKTSGTTSGTTISGYNSPGAQALQEQLIKQFAGMGTPNLAPYLAQQSDQINRNTGLQSKAVQAALAARGLSTSPIAANADVQNEAGRVSQITQLEQSIPLLQHQMELQNAAAAGGFLSSIPRTTSVTGETSGTTDTSQTEQGGQTGQTFQGQTSNTQQQGTSTNKTDQSSGGGIGGFFGGLATILAHLFG